MNDVAAQPQDSPEPSRHPGKAEVAAAVVAVRAWYVQQTLAEQRSAVPSAARLEELATLRGACADDLDRLEEAEAEEISRIADRYTARFKEFTGKAGAAS
jgi:hypothetical protein